MAMTAERVKEIQELADYYEEIKESSEEEEEEDIIITKHKKTPTKKQSTIKKGVQCGNLPGEKPKKGNKKPVKGKGKGKKAEKDQSTSGVDDLGSDSSSRLDSSVGNSNSGSESEDATRKVRQLSPR